METIIRTCQGDPPSFDSYGSSPRTPSRAFQNWINMVLKKQPKDRPKIDKVMNHSFLNRISLEDSQAILEEFISSIPDLDNTILEEIPSVKVDPKVKSKWEFSYDCFFHEQTTFHTTNIT